MIDSFEKEHRFLSNFYPVKIVYEGIEYPSVEHAYQAAKANITDTLLTFDKELNKFVDINTRERISKIKKPGDAKKIGNLIKIRKDWEAVKLNIMYELLQLKFKDVSLKWKLVQTKDKILIEGNTWHDNFWGRCTCDKCCNTGLNNLGKLLMKIRYEIT